MRFIFYIALVAGVIACCQATFAFADDQPEGLAVEGNEPDNSIHAIGVDAQPAMPHATADFQVAMIFYKLANRTPNFESWAQLSDTYANAEVFKKEWALDAEEKELKNTFAIFGKAEPIIVHFEVNLSDYDQKNKMYMIANLSPSTYFPYNWARRSYAVVPLDLEKHRFISVSGTGAADIDAAVRPDRARRAMMVLNIEPILPPKSADYPVSIANHAYYILSGNITNKALYDRRGKKLLWEEHPGIPWKETTISSHEEKQKDMLLDLKPN